MSTGVARRWLDVAIGAVLVGLVVVGALRWFDVTWQPVVVLQTAGPVIVVGLGLLVVATALLRRWLMLVPVGLTAAVAVGLAAPGFVAHTSPKDPRDLVVMSSNMLFGHADPDQLMSAVRDHGVDVLVLTEVTPEALGDLGAAGADRYFPERVGEARPDSFTGTVILSRFPLTEVSGIDDSDVTPSLQPEVSVRVGSQSVRLKAAHPVAPLAGETDQWRAGLHALEDWKDRQTGPQPILIVGDLNASYGHPGLRNLADGLVDAHVAAGLGWIRTWPVVGQRIPPYVHLDHLLSRGLTVVAAGQVAVHGADHTVMWAAYSVPKA